MDREQIYAELNQLLVQLITLERGNHAMELRLLQIVQDLNRARHGIVVTTTGSEK